MPKSFSILSDGKRHRHSCVKMFILATPVGSVQKTVLIIYSSAQFQLVTHIRQTCEGTISLSMFALQPYVTTFLQLLQQRGKCLICDFRHFLSLAGSQENLTQKWRISSSQNELRKFSPYSMLYLINCKETEKIISKISATQKDKKTIIKHHNPPQMVNQVH